MKKIHLVLVCCVLVGLAGCIKLDGFFFEAEKADSVEKDYHGLPLYVMQDPPDWLASGVVEREVYVDVRSARRLDEGELAASSGYIHGAFLKASSDCPTCVLSGSNITVLYQHGNSGHLFKYWYRAVALWNLGLNVFVYNYRGYGLSSGEASRTHILDDADAAMEYLLTRDDVDPSKIVAYGYSMGAIPTSYLVGVSEHRSQFFGAVLESGLNSVEAIIDYSTRTAFPDGFFFDDTKFDGPDFIEGSKLPILHLHGAEDTRVVMGQAEEYYEVLKGRDDYTHYLGKSENKDEDWIQFGGHRNLPIVTFKGEEHLADYWNHKKNDDHCCIHPLDYEDERHAEFLDSVGKTTGELMYESYEKYAELVTGWMQQLEQ